MFKKILALAAAAGLVLVGATAAQSAAAPELAIVKVGYNANGADTVSNRWKEYIDLKNVSGGPLDVMGWFTQDAWADSTNGDEAEPGDCNTAIFAADKLPFLDPSSEGADDLMLPAGHIIRVYTGGLPDTSDNSLHHMVINKSACGYNGHYLGNGGDTVYVKKADGTLVTKFTYSFDNGYWIR